MTKHLQRTKAELTFDDFNALLNSYQDLATQVHNGPEKSVQAPDVEILHVDNTRNKHRNAKPRKHVTPRKVDSGTSSATPVAAKGRCCAGCVIQ